MKDLTKGNPYKLIVLFALPVFLGCVFQQLYSMADTVIVGNTVNAAAFTGVGLTGPISFLILGFVNGLTAGFGVRIAQRFGAGDEDGVRRAVAISFLLCIGMTVLVTALAVPLTAPLLRLIKTPEEYFEYARSYLVIIFCGIGATVFYNMTAGILRAIGDSRSPLYFLVAAAVLNVGLDFAFIVGLKMHYHGAALATVISQLLSGAACLAFMLIRYPMLRLKKSDWKWDGKIVGGHIAVGLPMALQFSITAIGCIFQQTALNGLPESSLGAATAYVAASRIDNLANQTFNALGTAMATYAGQNSGAGRCVLSGTVPPADGIVFKRRNRSGRKTVLRRHHAVRVPLFAVSELRLRLPRHDLHLPQFVAGDRKKRDHDVCGRRRIDRESAHLLRVRAVLGVRGILSFQSHRLGRGGRLFGDYIRRRDARQKKEYEGKGRGGRSFRRVRFRRGVTRLDRSEYF